MIFVEQLKCNGMKMETRFCGTPFLCKVLSDMEHDQTDEEKYETIQWEKQQLEIMDWITNDVDWITGERHPNIMRIAWHQ